MYIAPGHEHTTTCCKFWQHFKAFIITIILYQFQKDPFASFEPRHGCAGWSSPLLFAYDIRHIFSWPGSYNILFNFIHVCIVPGKGETTFGDIFYGSRMVLSLWSLVACFKKYLCPLILYAFLHDFIHVYSLGRGKQPIWAKILMSTERPYHFNLWFYTHLPMI